jgi:hypothetical protein
MMGAKRRARVGFIATARWYRRGLIALAALALALALQSVALAASMVMLNDGFESTVASTIWRFDGQGTYNGAIKYGPNTASSGDYYARIYSPAGGWSAVGRPAHLTFSSHYQMSCTAGFYVRSPTGAKVNVEVIDPNTWNYIALKTYTIGVSGSYTNMTASWLADESVSEVFIRVAIGDPSNSRVAYVDRANVTCYW